MRDASSCGATLSSLPTLDARAAVLASATSFWCDRTTSGARRGATWRRPSCCRWPRLSRARSCSGWPTPSQKESARRPQALRALTPTRPLCRSLSKSTARSQCDVTCSGWTANRRRRRWLRGAAKVAARPPRAQPAARLEATVGLSGNCVPSCSLGGDCRRHSQHVVVRPAMLALPGTSVRTLTRAGRVRSPSCSYSARPRIEARCRACWAPRVGRLGGTHC